MDLSKCCLILLRRRWHRLGSMIGDIKLLFCDLHVDIEEWQDNQGMYGSYVFSFSVSPHPIYKKKNPLILFFFFLQYKENLTPSCHFQSSLSGPWPLCLPPSLSQQPPNRSICSNTLSSQNGPVKMKSGYITHLLKYQLTQDKCQVLPKWPIRPYVIWPLPISSSSSSSPPNPLLILCSSHPWLLCILMPQDLCTCFPLASSSFRILQASLSCLF